MVFVLKKADRKGATKYTEIIIDLQDFEVSEELENVVFFPENMKGLEEPEKLRKEDLQFEVFMKAFRLVSSVTILTPLPNYLQVECSLKASQGHLFLLNHKVIFVSTQFLVLPHKSIARIITREHRRPRLSRGPQSASPDGASLRGPG